MSPFYFWLDLLGSIPFVSRIITSICYPQSAAFADYTASERVLAYFILSIWRQRLCLPPELLQCLLRHIQANLCVSCFFTLLGTEIERKENSVKKGQKLSLPAIEGLYINLILIQRNK